MVFQQAALAGPPLICHPFDIGNARSLPWSGSEWRAVAKNYDINKTNAIALFDYGYLVESYKQAGDGSQGVTLAGGVDGYGMIVKAIALGGGDPAMEFAAALAKEDRTGGHIAHLQRAAAGAPEGSLLARNLLSHFSNMGKTIAELRANVAKN